MTDYAAYHGRVTFTGVLTLQSPLHVGSGFANGFVDAAKQLGEINDIVMGVNGLPVIPATTLKGALRAAVSQSNAAAADRLFGQRLDHTLTQPQGSPGILVPYAAQMSSANRNVDGRIESQALRNNQHGTYVAQRTAVDPASGTADDGKLFAKRVVARGATFQFRMVLVGAYKADGSDVPEAVWRLFKTMESGFSVGAGKGDAQGHLTLTDLVVDRRYIEAGQVKDERMDWSALHANLPVYASHKARWTLQLTGTEPFFIHAPHAEQSGAHDNVMRGLRHNSNTPELSGPSLMGALRAKAEWQVRLANHRASKASRPEHYSPFLIDELFGAKAETLAANADKLAIRLRARQPGSKLLSRDFSGFAGMLKVVSIEEASVPPITVHSVKLDKVTQGPMDGGLFAVEAYLEPGFTVVLELDHRADSDHIAFVESFLSDVTSPDAVMRGLMLGHGTNRGFGRFDVSTTGGANG